MIFILKNHRYLYILILLFFSFFVNFYYSSLGAFPIDSFLHYDSAYRILKGDLPIKDFWIVSGLTVDFIQSILFKLFGTSWNIYILHSSLFNSFLTIFLFLFFIDFKVNEFKAFTYCLSFAVLAYTISGTPFVDLHATFFFTSAIILILYNLKYQKRYIWFIVVILFYLSFLSKQVPAAYGIIIFSFILLFYLLKIKKFDHIYFIFFSSLLLLFLTLLTLYLSGIELKNFFLQYFKYPISIGDSRLDYFNKSLNTIFNQYKFIFFSLVIYCLVKYKSTHLKSQFFFTEIFLVIGLSLILIFHQEFTKNQIYIYFILPVIFGLIEIEVEKLNFKFKSHLSILMLTILILLTFKYHHRYNENRKFHELSKIDLNNTIDASQIDKSLSGLKWINPIFNGTPKEEILILKQSIKKLNEVNENIMLVSNYLFLDSVTLINLNNPNRAFTADGTNTPLKKNKYFKNYKSFFLKKLRNKKITKIYFFKVENLKRNIILSYLDRNCYDYLESEIFYIYNLRCFY